MRKKNVLGTDPLSWLKEKDKNKSSENIQSDIDNKEKQRDKLFEPKVVIGKSENSKTQEAQTDEVSNIEKAVKITKYEPDSESGMKKQEEEGVHEPGGIAEENRRKVLGEQAYSYHSRTREETQKESPATIFVIVYTVLMLILGFIVYRDLTKQIETLNTKLTNVEKQLDKDKINYEDTKVNDVW